MIIWATKKVLNLSKKPSVKNDQDESDSFPGEWYVNLVSLGQPGKFGLQFLHSPTYISVIVPGRSLNKVIGQFKIRVENFLLRHGYEKLIQHFSLDTHVQIYSTNSRSIQAHMNQIKLDTEYHCSEAESLDRIDFSWIEDIFIDYPFSSQKLSPGYHTSQEILNRFMKELFVIQISFRKDFLFSFPLSQAQT